MMNVISDLVDFYKGVLTIGFDITTTFPGQQKFLNSLKKGTLILGRVLKVGEMLKLVTSKFEPKK